MRGRTPLARTLACGSIALLLAAACGGSDEQRASEPTPTPTETPTPTPEAQSTPAGPALPDFSSASAKPATAAQRRRIERVIRAYANARRAGRRTCAQLAPEALEEETRQTGAAAAKACASAERPSPDRSYAPGRRVAVGRIAVVSDAARALAVERTGGRERIRRIVLRKVGGRWLILRERVVD